MRIWCTIRMCLKNLSHTSVISSTHDIVGIPKILFFLTTYHSTFVSTSVRRYVVWGELKTIYISYSRSLLNEVLLHDRCRDDKLTSGCCRDESKFVSVLITRASLSNNRSSHCFFASHAWPGLSSNLLWFNFWTVVECRLLDCLKRHSKLLEQKKKCRQKILYYDAPA